MFCHQHLETIPTLQVPEDARVQYQAWNNHDSQEGFLSVTSTEVVLVRMKYSFIKVGRLKSSTAINHQLVFTQGRSIHLPILATVLDYTFYPTMISIQLKPAPVSRHATNV